MDLVRAKKLLGCLSIRHRDTGQPVPFRLNPCQELAWDIVYNTRKAGKAPRFIILKSRRVGMSSFFDGLAFCHCLAYPNANGLILAHEAKSSRELYKVPLGLFKSLPVRIGPDPTESRIKFNRGHTISELAIATAGSFTTGRGFTLSFLHLSEAAWYPAGASFLSLLPSVSYHPDTMVAIESTANGRTGIGKPFYDQWIAAVAGRSEYTPIFISWLDDPTCVRDPEEIKDALLDEDESALVVTGATQAQLAWRRWSIEANCQGRLELFKQEYPTTPDEAFLSSGYPAFDETDIRIARATVKEPVQVGRIEPDAQGVLTFRADTRGSFWVWEKPQPSHHYYIGADAARGVEHGDFAAAVIWDGSTGHQVARLADRVSPERLALFLNLIGRWYNRALVNVELTGNLGLEVQRRLRSDYNYPNIYRRKLKDDKLISKGSMSLGWETNQRTRDMAFQVFRASLREEEVVVRDSVLLSQMDAAQMDTEGAWRVQKGHDDILMAGLIGWVARQQYPPPRLGLNLAPPRSTASEGDEMNSLPAHQVDDLEQRLQVHARQVAAATANWGRPGALDGV